MRKFDANEYNDADRNEALKPGKYLAIIVDDGETGFVNRRQGGKGDYLVMTYKILNPQKHRGMRVWSNQSLSDAALPMLARLYKAVEPDEHNRPPFDLDNDGEIHAALYYKPLKITVDLETTPGYNPTLRVKQWEAVVGEEYDAAMDLAQKLLNDPNTGSEWGAGPRQGGTTDNNQGTSFEIEGEDDEELPF